jgi:DNA-binding NarL/FixJ family response regulator
MKVQPKHINTRVIIADDHAIIREGLKSLLEKKGVTVLAIAQNGREAIELAVEHQPDLVLMDIAMPDLNGVDATAAIKKRVPSTKVIALSMHSTKKHIENMFSSGASAYIIKESAFEELMDAIEEVNQGNYYLSPSIARMYVDNQGNRFTTGDDMPTPVDLSKKERQVLQLVAEGQKNRDIAEILDVSIKTVETHRRNIMKKLSIFNIAGLTRFAIKEGIVSLD